MPYENVVNGEKRFVCAFLKYSCVRENKIEIYLGTFQWWQRTVFCSHFKCHTFSFFFMLCVLPTRWELCRTQLWKFIEAYTLSLCPVAMACHCCWCGFEIFCSSKVTCDYGTELKEEIKFLFVSKESLKEIRLLL